MRIFRRSANKRGTTVRSRRARCKIQADVKRSMEKNVRRTSGDGIGGSCLDESSANTKGRCVHFHKTVSIGPARRHTVFHRRFSFIFGFVSPTYTILEETRSVHPISRRVNTLANGKPSNGYSRPTTTRGSCACLRAQQRIARWDLAISRFNDRTA